LKLVNFLFLFFYYAGSTEAQESKKKELSAETRLRKTSKIGLASSGELVLGFYPLLPSLVTFMEWQCN
jgi:hypothetical protein